MVEPLSHLGREITPDLFKKTYARFADQALRPAPEICSVTRDLAYGEDVRHKLDIFVPVKTHKRALTVLVFVHGGGFKHGDKGTAEAPFYNNVGAWAAQNGLLGVTMTYRLAPQHQWPSGSLDVAAAVTWLVNNIDKYGGDPTRICLVGQSAGAVHVAGYVADQSLQDASGKAAAAVMISGIYDLTRFPRNPFEHAYYGTDPSVMADRSTLGGLLTAEISCLYAVAEWDSMGFQQQAGYLVSAHLEKRGQWPKFVYALGHNHLSTVYTLGNKKHRLGEQILEFCKVSQARMTTEWG